MSDKCKHGIRDTTTNLPYCRRCDNEGKRELADANSSTLANALSERDAYFNEAARVKGTLADVIPALEKASGLCAEDFRNLARVGGDLTGNEIAALWMARAILEAPNDKLSGSS